MAKLLSDLRTQTRMFLDESTQSDWLDTEVDVEINAFYQEVVTAVMETYEDFYLITDNMDSVADQQEYNSTDGLPTDIFKIRRLELNYNVSDSNSIPQKAVSMTIDEVNRDLGNSALSVTVTSNPAYYFIGSGSGATGATLGIIPKPSNDGTDAFKLWYIPIIDDLSAAGDSVNIPYPDRYAKIISLGAAGMLLRKGQQEEEVATRYLTEAEVGMEKMKQQLESRLSDNSKRVVDSAAEDVDFSINL